MTFTDKLKEQSAAYAAYAALPRLPKNAPRFTDSPHGYPIVEPGEIFCRLEGVGRPCCGAKTKSTDLLLYHMEAIHGAMRRDWPLDRKRTKVEVSELERLHYFYKHLTKDEEYAGKHRAMPPSPEALAMTQSVTSASSATKPGLKRKATHPSSSSFSYTPRAAFAKRKAFDERSIDSAVAQTILPPVKRPRTEDVFGRPAPERPRPSAQKLELLKLRGQKLLQEIAVNEATIQSELKESQLKEVRIKAELLEAQLLEAQIAQDVQRERLKHVELERNLKEIVEKDRRVRLKLEDVVQGRGSIVDLLDDESEGELVEGARSDGFEE